MERIKIKNICEVNPKQEILDDNFIISFIGMAQISNDNQFDTSILKKYEDVKKGFSSFKDGDILFAKITPCMENGKGVLIENLYNGIGFGSTEFHVLRPNIKVVDKKYLYWFTMYKKFRLNCEKNMTGSAGQKRVPKNYIENYEIKLPELIIQEKRAKILDNILKIKQEKLEQLKRLEELNKSIFVKMFGDPILDDSINKIELEKICKISSSKRIFEKEYVSEGIPFYRTKEIVELAKGNKISTELYISKKRYLEIKEQFEIPQENDILITAVGTIGTIWIVDNNREFYFKDGNILRISASKKFNSIYMKRLLEILIENLSKSLSTGTAYSALTINSLKKMLIKDIDLKMQNRYANKIRKIEKSKFLFICL